jgi:hypothetical protein
MMQPHNSWGSETEFAGVNSAVAAETADLQMDMFLLGATEDNGNDSHQHETSSVVAQNGGKLTAEEKAKKEERRRRKRERRSEG